MKINEQYYERYPSIRDGLMSPTVSHEAVEIYNFIAENQYSTINIGGGMGTTIAVAPNMIDFIKLGDYDGIDAYRYKKYIIDFINKKTELQQRKSKWKTLSFWNYSNRKIFLLSAFLNIIKSDLLLFYF